MTHNTEKLFSPVKREFRVFYLIKNYLNLVQSLWILHQRGFSLGWANYVALYESWLLARKIVLTGRKMNKT